MLSSRRAARWVTAHSRFPSRVRVGAVVLGAVVAATNVFSPLPLVVSLCAAFVVWVVLLRPVLLEFRAQLVAQLVERRWRSSDRDTAVWVASIMVDAVSSGRLEKTAPTRLWALSAFSEDSPLLGPWLHTLLTGVLVDLHLGIPHVRSAWYKDELLASTARLAVSCCAAEALEVVAQLPFVHPGQPPGRHGRRADDLELAASVAECLGEDRELARLCVALAPSWLGSPSDLVEAARALLGGSAGGSLPAPFTGAPFLVAQGGPALTV
jgi:hypothetical protein